METLEKAGATADGKVRLYAGETLLQEISAILNIAPPPEDPYVVDDFESYAGVTDMMLRSWSVNKDGGCTLEVSNSTDCSFDGGHSLKFDYKETKNGWAGCEFPKTTDWSGCNCLQFWVVPDGKNQKTVVQINTSTGGSYEAYLQEYPEYASSAEPLLVTLPFEEFRDKNGKGALDSANAANISGIGLWVNAIPDSEAIDQNGEVAGVLYYDCIRAIHALNVDAPVFEALSGAESASAEPVQAQGTAATERKLKFGAVPAVAGTISVLSLLCLTGLAVGGRKKGGGKKDE